MKIRFICLVVLIISLIGAAGCGSSGGGAPMAAQATTAAATRAAMANYDGAEFESGSFMDLSVSKSTAGGNTSGNAGGGDTETEGQQLRKLIKNVRCQIAVKDVGAAYYDVYNIVQSLGGYEYSKTESKSNGDAYYSIVFKLPPDNIPEFEYRLRSATGENALKYFNLSSDDITSAYYDVSSRLYSMRASLQQYLAMLSKAVTIKDMLEIQREITSLQAEIDSLQGQLNIWNMLVDYATIDISIEKEADPLAPKRNEQWSFNTPSEIVNSMGNGFIATGNAVYRIIVGIIVVVVSLLPAVIPIGLIVLLVLYIRRKARAKRGDAVAKKADNPLGRLFNKAAPDNGEPDNGAPQGDTSADPAADITTDIHSADETDENSSDK